MIKPSSLLTLTYFMIYHHLFQVYNKFSLMLKNISEVDVGEGGVVSSPTQSVCFAIMIICSS